MTACDQKKTSAPCGSGNTPRMRGALGSPSLRAASAAVAIAVIGLGLTGCGASPGPTRPTSTLSSLTTGPVPEINTRSSTVALTGIVIDPNRHVGITGMTVTFRGDDGAQYTAVTDAKATYSVSLAPGVYTVSCKSGVLDCAAAQAPTVSEPSVTIRANGQLNLDVIASVQNSQTPAHGPAESGAYGRVTKDGVGVAGVEVLVDQYTPAIATIHETATTDSDGNYSVSDLPPGVYTVSTLTDGYCYVGDSNAVTLPAGGEVDFKFGMCGQ